MKNVCNGKLQNIIFIDLFYPARYTRFLLVFYIFNQNLKEDCIEQKKKKRNTCISKTNYYIAIHYLHIVFFFR